MPQARLSRISDLGVDLADTSQERQTLMGGRQEYASVDKLS